MTTQKTDFKTVTKSLEDTLELYLVKKAPSLPTNAKDVIVSIAPWLTLVFVIIAIPAILLVLGLGTLLMPFGFLGGPTVGFQGMASLLALILTLPSVILEGMAIPGLFARSRQGWNFLFYSTVLSGLYNLVTFNLSGLIIGTLLSLYLLFQVRSYYK